MPIDLVIEDRDGGCREDLEDYAASCPSLPDQVGTSWQPQVGMDTAGRHVSHQKTSVVSAVECASHSHSHVTTTHRCSWTTAQALPIQPAEVRHRQSYSTDHNEYHLLKQAPTTRQ